jgi:hypothetical protein
VRFFMTALAVRDLGSPLDPQTLAAAPPAARIQWRRLLSTGELDRVLEWLAARPQASLRLYGAACAQVGVLAGARSLRRLELAASRLPSRLPELPGVTDLTLDGVPPDAAALLAAFPQLRILQIVLRSRTIDAAGFARVPHLERLSLAAGRLSNAAALLRLPALGVVELRDVQVDDLAGVLRVPGLRALRLRGMSGVRWIDALAGCPHMRVLALDSLLHLESVRVLATLPRLESLDVAGLWQFGLDDVGFIPAMTSLRRFRIDIGGRRKNVELYKRLSLPRPPPFDVRDADFATT